MRKAIWTAGLAATALTTTLLITGGGPRSITSEAVAASGLLPFDDCAELAEWYRSAALEEVTAYGLGGGDLWVMVDAAYGGDVATGAVEAAAARSDSVANGATGTNLQEAGVDEPDVAKTDGALTYVVDGRHLVVTDVSGAEPVEAGRLELPRRLQAAEMLLVGDSLVLFAGVPQHWGGARDAFGTFPNSPGSTLVAVVDVSEPAAMRIDSEREVEGSRVAAREHKGTVRVVVRSHPELDFVTPYPRWDLPRRERWRTDRRSAREALAENRRIIREADAQDFLPQQRLDGGAGEPLLDCSDVTHPEIASGLGTISLLTFDPTTPAAIESAAISAVGDQVYASTDRLYVATAAGGGWFWEEDSSRVARTEVHAFDVTGSDTAYVASGEVPGYAPDRWSFSEHEGRLRVATTEQKLFRDIESTVTVLEEVGGQLVTVGSVSGMGPGEQIQSVRWFGDLAIVVTFEQTDPLYTVDLSDPLAPEVLGELKIPGFSAYLHPLGDDLLLGVGQDATSTGQTTGSQVSSFDLSDLRAPGRISALDMGRHTYSPVEDDARTFTYLPQQRLALVPVSTWSGRGDRLLLVRVGEDGALSEVKARAVHSAYGLRTLPLADGRVAVVDRGEVTVLDPGL
jgi:uncharacterized secreted protein with C-terminal beta-propeller domain